ncbi:MAG: elongation factor G, partial [Chloroflexota bacterium]|nr:elongation factor G [Chloroflexota bacterium]
SEERIGQLLFVRGREQENTDHIAAGDLGAVAKLAETLTSHTLSERKQPLVLPAVTFPSWLFTAAIEPTSKEDLEKLSSALARVTEEDPSLHVERQQITGQTLFSGIGETHINVALERMKRKFGADVKTVPVKVPYKETIMGTAAAEGRFVRQTGGHGQYAVCNIEIEPTSRGEGFEFVDKIFGGAISAPFREAVHKGIREAMKEGTLASGEVVDLRVTLVDGKEHTVDSSDLAFQIAGSMALKEATDRAKPVLLEPVLQMKVRVPEDRMGDVIGDLTSRRARVHNMDMVSPGTMEVEAEVPQAEVLRYATDLRSLTQGRATFTSEFIGYEQVPASTQEQVVEAHKREKEEASA